MTAPLANQGLKLARGTSLMIGRLLLFLLLAAGLGVGCAADEPAQTPPQNAAANPEILDQFIKSNCLECHDKVTKSAGLILDGSQSENIEQNVEVWEKVVRKLAARQMPPKGSRRPAE